MFFNVILTQLCKIDILRIFKHILIQTMINLIFLTFQKQFQTLKVFYKVQVRLEKVL